MATAALSLTGSTFQLDAQLVEDLMELFHCCQPSLKIISAVVEETAEACGAPSDTDRLTILINTAIEMEEK
mgnify:CR=1 FL=1